MAHITVKDEPATAGRSMVKDLYQAEATERRPATAGPQAVPGSHEATQVPLSAAICDICGCSASGGAVTLDGNQVVPEEQTRFLAGLGIRGREDLQQSLVPPRFLHGDLIGSTMMETGPTGEVESTGGWNDSLLWQYTAFGEPIWPQAATPRGVGYGRYKYAGTYGYESGFVYLWGANEALPPILLSHVGERWYEPGTGRFVQRDPIGLRGGLNAYAYCANKPLACVDPAGGDAHAAVRGIGALWVMGGAVLLVLPGGQVAGTVCILAGTAMWAHEDIAAILDAIDEEDAGPEVDESSGPGGGALIDPLPTGELPDPPDPKNPPGPRTWLPHGP